MRSRLDEDVYVVVDRWQLARRNAQAVSAHLAVYGMRQCEGVAEKLALLRGAQSPLKMTANCWSPEGAITSRIAPQLRDQ